jgi:hypothetical protein
LVSEAWPSWICVLSSLRLTCSVVFITNDSSLWQPTFCKIYPNTAIFPSVQLDTQLPAFPGELVLFQGSASWFHQMGADLLSHFPPPLPIVPGITQGMTHLPQPWQSVVVSAHSCGSVLAHDWRFWIRDHAVPTNFVCTYARCLRHVIDSTTGPPFGSRSFSPCLLASDWLPFTQPFLPVLCPSIFSPEAPVQRQLTTVELARAFDVPSAWIPFFSQWSTSHRTSLPFLLAIPSKVLMWLGLQLFSRERGEGGVIASLTRNHLSAQTALFSQSQQQKSRD